MKKILSLFALSFVLVGCSGLSSYVESDESELGRVVVYRNGIAYFERRARIEGKSLTLKVPHDKVDDFLKSLTVTDAKSGKPLPVSFPTRGAAKDGNVEMTIRLPKSSGRELLLSYITESPSWKPSYRVVVRDDGKVDLQAWAIVDNTSGEDWNNVRLGVGSSSALSFRYDLRSIRLVERERLHSHERFAKAPPRGGAVHTTRSSTEAVLAELDDNEIPRPIGHPENVAKLDFASSALSGQSPSVGSGQIASKRKDSFSGNSARVKRLARKLQRNRSKIIIEGYAARNETNQRSRSLDRANLLRNQLIAQGVAPAQLQVRAGRGARKKSGVRLISEQASAKQGKKNPALKPDSEPIGESHFESKKATTVPRGTSAMVALLDKKTEGEVVYLYDAAAERGNKRYAFRSVRFKNSTTSTLEGGPVTVYGQKRFIGEGLSEAVPPGNTAVIPFAMDRQIVVSRKGSTRDEISRLIKLNRGVLTAEVKHRKKTALTLTNRSKRDAIVLIRHSVRKGWELVAGPKVYEKMGESHLFTIDIKAGQTRSVSIVEVTPLRRTVDLRSTVGVSLIRVYLKGFGEGTQFKKTMGALLRVHAEMANHQEAILNIRARMQEYRERLDELHVQIVSLKAFKAGGTLMRHLQAKMKQISNKVQNLTLKVVNNQEKLMLARIRFQDGLSELTLDTQISSAKPTP